MVAIKVLRILVACEIALLFTSTLAAFYLPTETTPALDAYLEGPGAGPLLRMFEAGPGPPIYLLMALAAAFLASYIASLVGLLLLKPWARRLFAILFAIGIGIYPLMGTTVSDPISTMIEYLGAAGSGAILAILYLSDARTVFDSRAPDKSREHTRGEY